MSTYEKIDQPGLTVSITRPPPAARDIRAHVLSTIEDVDSTHCPTPSLTPTSSRNRDTTPLNHSDSNMLPTPSMDTDRTVEFKQAAMYETDLEACMHTNEVKITPTHNDGKVWPGRRTLMSRYKADKKKRQTCNPMRNLDKRTKVCIKILIIFLVVGGATGLGIGISKAVGGGIWKTNNSTKSIPR